MIIKRHLKNIAAIACCLLSYCSVLNAQDENHVTSAPFNSTLITIDKFEWKVNQNTKKADATITLTNNATIAIKSVSIQITGVDKKGTMLQSDNHTIEQSVNNIKILPKQTQSVSFAQAYNNEALGKLVLKKVTIEFENGSLQVLN